MPATRKTKILIVDDRPENILALSNLLAAPDLELVTAGSGNDALAALLDHEVALAVLDVQMPGMSGFELARLMRGANHTRHIPIIFVTASEFRSADVFEGYGYGAVDYLFKPLDPHVVRSKVHVFVELDQKSHALQEKLAEVERLKLSAEEASRAKSQFLANMSHEIRNPLSALLGFSELLCLSTNNPNAEQRACMDAIGRNGATLLQLIEDILDLSKIEADRVEAEIAPAPLSDLLHDVRTLHLVKAREKSVDFRIEAEGELPVSISTDRLRLKQVLNNVIGNALKFTEQGSVRVHVSLPSRAPGREKLRFLVTDSGCGIPESSHAKIFSPFMQADASTTRRFGGTGLGLAISQRLARLLGGDVQLVRSAEGSGSTFSVDIATGPLADVRFLKGSELIRGAPPRVPERGGASDARLRGTRVLIIDDAVDNLRIFSKLLALSGAEVEVASESHEGVELAMARNFDVVLMDIQMPGMDGYQAMRELRERGYLRPVVALTANAMRDDVEKCMRAGFRRHLTKPVGRSELVEAVSECLD